MAFLTFAEAPPFVLKIPIKSYLIAFMDIEDHYRSLSPPHPGHTVQMLHVLNTDMLKIQKKMKWTKPKRPPLRDGA